MKKLLIYIICIACSLELTAQTATPTTADTLISAEPATLAHFISTGLQNNYRLRIVRNEERLAESNATRANAGMLPSVTASAGYGGALNSSNTTARGTGETSRSRNVLDHTLHAGINAEWTIFDGFKIQTNYQRLQELRRQSATQTRVAIEDYVAELTSEYYNFIRQRLRMRNLRHAVALSKERLRIVLERYTIGSASRLDLQQAQVDFNADSALSLKQHEVLASSLIRLYDLMAIKDMSKRFTVADTAIDVDTHLLLDTLWSTTLRTNANLLNAAHNRTLSEIDLRSVRSRDYPYVKLNAAYGYTHNNYGSGNTVKRHNWGLDFGVTVGYKIFDGNRRRERRNAKINLENAELARQEIEHSLRADLADIWQAYKNNLRLLALERENLITAKENHYIACERFMLGNLSGIEMREAQQNLLDAEERILDAEFNTKLCEISLRQISGGIMHYAK